nr:hypothetical protein [Tanacetum cinerariifolium]
ETPKVLLLAWDRVFKIKDALGNKQYKLEELQELFRQLLNDVQNIHEELAEYINTPGWNRPAFYDDDDGDDDVDYTIAITPVLSTEEPIDSLTMGDEHLDTIPATGSDEDDNLREKLLNVYLLIANIEALKDNPTQSSKLLTKSSSTSPKSFLEETNTFHNSLPEFENFYFDLEEISSVKISGGSTTTHSDIPLSEYDSFIFDFTHEEFVDELAHIISPPEYDCFYFWNLPDPGELMSILNSGIRENLSSTTCVNLPIEADHSPLLAYIVWIFLAYLTYSVIPPYLHPFGNEDTIFDPGITINRFYSSKPGLSHRCAHTGYNCPPKVPIISNPEPCNQTMNNELPQTLPSFDTTCYSDKENLVPCVSKPNFVDESSNIFNPPPQPPIYSCEFCGSNAQYGHYRTPQAPFNNPEPEMEDLKQQYLDELRLSNLEYRDEIKIAELTENLNGMSIEIRKKEKLLQQEYSEVMEIVIPEEGGIDDDIPLTIKDDNLRDKLLNVNLLI